MRIFKDAWFSRFAWREKISDDKLKGAIVRAESGSIDADLGGGVIKQRISRPGQGKSGGYRSVIVYRKGDLAFFLYGFAKSERDNISMEELADFKKLAKGYLALSGRQIEVLLLNRELTEIL